MLPQNAATPQNIQISNVERLCCSARRRRQIGDISIYSDFKRRPPVAEPSSLCRQRRLDNFRFQPSRALVRPKILKKIVLPQADLNFEFQSQPWWTKCEWRLPPLDIKSNFTKLKISTTKIQQQIRDGGSTALYAADMVYTVHMVYTVVDPSCRIHASPRAWLAGSEQPRRLQDKKCPHFLVDWIFLKVKTLQFFTGSTSSKVCSYIVLK